MTREDKIAFVVEGFNIKYPYFKINHEFSMDYFMDTEFVRFSFQSKVDPTLFFYMTFPISDIDKDKLYWADRIEYHIPKYYIEALERKLTK